MSTYAEYLRHGAIWAQSGTTVTSKLPTYHDGELALMVAVVNGETAFPTPAGWTAVAGSPWAYGGAVVPPQVWDHQQITACWKILSGSHFGTSDGPTFTLDDSEQAHGGRIYVFRQIDMDTFDEVAFTGTPVVASSLVNYDGRVIDPPELPTPTSEQTVTYPELDAGVVGNHQWLAFNFVHASFPLAWTDYPNQVTPDNMQIIDPGSGDGGSPPGTFSGPTDTVDHNESEGGWFFAYNAGDTPGDGSPTDIDTFQPDPTTWGLVNFDFLNPPSDFYDVLPAVAGITMVVLGSPTVTRPVGYWGIRIVPVP